MGWRGWGKSGATNETMLIADTGRKNFLTMNKKCFRCGLGFGWEVRELKKRLWLMVDVGQK